MIAVYSEVAEEVEDILSEWSIEYDRTDGNSQEDLESWWNKDDSVQRYLSD